MYSRPKINSSEAAKKAFETVRQKGTDATKRACVLMYKGKALRKFKSATECSLFLGLHEKRVARCINENRLVVYKGKEVRPVYLKPKKKVKAVSQVTESNRYGNNEIIVKDKYAIMIVIRKGVKHCVKIDIKDIAKVKIFKWNLTNNGYVMTNVDYKGRKYVLLLHRYLLKLKPGDKRFVGDHWDNDKLNNRSKNLFKVTYSGNVSNIIRHKGRDRNITYIETSGKYRVRVGGYDLSPVNTLEEARILAKKLRRKVLSHCNENRIINANNWF